MLIDSEIGTRCRGNDDLGGDQYIHIWKSDTVQSHHNRYFNILIVRTVMELAAEASGFGPKTRVEAHLRLEIYRKATI